MQESASSKAPQISAGNIKPKQQYKDYSCTNTIMHFIQIDIPNNDLLLDAGFGFQVRTSYLLGDVSTIVGNNTFLITYDYVVKHLSISQMCALVLQYQNSTQELKDIVEGYYGMVKQMKAHKHAPNNVFVAFKKFENTLHASLKPFMEGISAHVKECGYQGIFEFYNKDSFVFYHPEEKSIIDVNTHINVGKVLANKVPTNAIDTSIWLLPFIFYATDVYDCDAITDVNLIEANKPYLIKCIELTNYVFITPVELTSIKHQLENAILLFKTAMEEWAIDCRKATNGINTFINKVLPTLKDTQAAIDDNEILKHSRSIEAGKPVINLYMGEVTPPILWKYYLLHEMLSAEEYDQLIDEYNTQPTHTLPIILFSPQTIPFNRIDIEACAKVAEITEPEEVLATKKSINID